LVFGTKESWFPFLRKGLLPRAKKASTKIYWIISFTKSKAKAHATCVRHACLNVICEWKCKEYLTTLTSGCWGHLLVFKVLSSKHLFVYIFPFSVLPLATYLVPVCFPVPISMFCNLQSNRHTKPNITFFSNFKVIITCGSALLRPLTAMRSRPPREQRKVMRGSVVFRDWLCCCWSFTKQSNGCASSWSSYVAYSVR
jgi:hypothetical protein